MNVVTYYYILLSVMNVLYKTVISETIKDGNNGNGTGNVLVEKMESSRVLSRRKRFLLFPDGSSFQLVYCVQTSALIPIGDIFLYGSTAALAWSLPTDPEFIKKFTDQQAHRRGDLMNRLNGVDDKAKHMFKKTNRRGPPVYPVFAKRSIDSKKMKYKQKLKVKIDRMRMHEEEMKEDFLRKQLVSEKVIEFHRSSRVDLFEKLEKLFTALGEDGRQCVLYKLCESARTASRQGTFLHEFLRVIFTLPEGREFDNNERQEYDEARKAGDDCIARYPGCSNFHIPLPL